MKPETITIKKIVNNGFGLGHLANGRAILLRQVLPGEKVLVIARKLQKDTLFSTQLQILTAHPQRKSAPCPYYENCGGCDLQHTQYHHQLTIKRDIIIDLLNRHGLPELVSVGKVVTPVLPSPAEFHYRQRIRLHFDDDSLPCFRHYQSHRLVQIDACMLAVPQLNTALAAVCRHSAGRQLRQLSSGMELQFNPATGKTIVLLDMNQKPRPKAFQAASAFLDETEIIEQVYFRGEGFALTRAGRPTTTGEENSDMAIHYARTESRPPISFLWEPGSFCQVNLSQNSRLIDLLLQTAEVKTHETVLDLYCGMGNFGLPLARNARSVLGYEGQAAAIRSAKKNAQIAAISNARFAKQPIHAACEALVTDHKQFDLVVVDPPRQGIPGLYPQLAKLCRDRLLYVSCDPATLVRDLGQLIAHGFRVHSVQPVDMFPQTHHVETVVLLSRAQATTD
jgi:23S rRNA (uracil1939-C5)-methyltransferase